MCKECDESLVPAQVAAPMTADRVWSEDVRGRALRMRRAREIYQMLPACLRDRIGEEHVASILDRIGTQLRQCDARALAAAIVHYGEPYAEKLDEDVPYPHRAALAIVTRSAEHVAPKVPPFSYSRSPVAIGNLMGYEFED